MNILQVLPELSTGGVERTAIEISKALTDQGHGSHVASLGGRLEAELSQAGGTLHRLDMKTKNPFKWRANTKALIELIKQENIDLVHVRSRAPARSARAAAKACGVPFVTTYHGIYNAKSKLKRRYNSAMTRGDVVIANSQFTADHILAEHNILPAKVTIIPRGVDMNKFDPKAIDEAAVKALREQWGIGASQKCLLLPGRMTARKGHLIAIKALATVRKHEDAALVLLGDVTGHEAYITQIQTAAQELGIEEHVKIAGHSDHVQLAIMASSIVISASIDPESFGRTAIEAQAMGKWVVASDHGGARETVIDGVTGARVTPSDPAALSDAVLEGLSLKPDPESLRAHIQSNFSDERMKTSVLAVYICLLP